MAKPMTAKEKKYANQVADFGCIVCSDDGRTGVPSEIHHIRTTANRIKKHSRIIPLCFLHHRGGGKGVAIHDGLSIWEERHGTQDDLEKQLKDALQS